MILEKIKKHLEERNSINEELGEIMGYFDNSPIEIDLESKWSQDGDSLWISEDGKQITDDGENCIPYTISSYSAKGEELFIGEKDGITYVMVYPEDENWDDTTIFVLSNENKFER